MDLVQNELYDQLQRVSIRFLNPDLKLIGEIDQYSSLQFTHKWNTYSVFELQVGTFNPLLFQTGNFILLEDNLNSLGYITQFSIEERHFKKTVTVKGFCPRWVYFNRPTLPPAGKDEDTFNTEIENIILGLMEHNCTNPENPNRKIPNLLLRTSQNRGEKLSFQTRYKWLYEEMQSLSELSKLGTGTELDYNNKKIIFEVLQGVDRTYENGVRAPYTFSKDLNRINSRNYAESELDYKNCAYVAGQGEGADREVIILGNEKTGYDRREIFFDARDIGEDANTTLEDRGKIRLAEYPYQKDFSAEVDARDYRKKWDLGDFVTIVDEETGIIEDHQITEVKETYEKGTRKVEPVFGQKLSGITDRIKKNAASPVSYQGKQGEPGENGKTPNFRLDEDGNLYAIYE
ncbi:Gp37-like protein [Eubacterium callanderi]|uniref:Siphovirus ReqiPepy6 Gp37-like family protein n=2 Tax=Bacillota TaxID=1239 RepID=A0A853JQN3_9FIRM|nr:siphovirus ReqiPepy6 Gp37-like family protein [Eubacterium callanderi]